MTIAKFSALVLSASSAAGGLAAAPEVTVQSITQDPLSALVTVVYTTTGPSIVTCDAQTNVSEGVWASIGGSNQWHWAGATGLYLPAGQYTNYWAVGVDFPGFELTDSTRINLTAWSPDCPPNYMVVDFAARTNSIYYVGEEWLPGGVHDARYKTTSLALRKCPAANVVWTAGSPFHENGRVTARELQRHVMLTEDYYLSVYEFTRRQFFLIKDQSDVDGIAAKGGTQWFRPVSGYSWNKFRGGNWVTGGHDSVVTSSVLGLLRCETGIAFDLPTAAQWEFACRAGTTDPTYAGPLTSATDAATGKLYSPEADKIAWTWHNWTNDPEMVSASAAAKHAVGLMPSNPWGFYDILGNVAEMTLDFFNDSVQPSRQEIDVDPIGPDSWPEGSTTAQGHQWRGGDFYHTSWSYCRSAYWMCWAQSGEDTEMFQLGFRVACPARPVRFNPMSEGGR